MSGEKENCAWSPRSPLTEEQRLARVRELNDQLRRTGEGGRILLTRGVLALGYEAVIAIREAVSTFDAFSPGNDPHGEHDFGSLTYRRRKVFWKIDCYDNTLQSGSPDPADPDVTTRVLTIMLASEY